MNYDITEIGEICVSSQFDEDLYSDYLSDNGLVDSPSVRNAYIRDECFYDVEFFNSEDYHHMGYEQMTIDEIESEFGEEMAKDISNDCLDGNEHRYEPLSYMNDEVNINSPSELAKAAMKCLRTGDYSKNCRGFILSNGLVAYTDAEHSMCTRINGVKSTSHFIELGNIRVLDHSIDIAKPPTSHQKSTLEEVLSAYRGEELYLDLCNRGLNYVSIKYTECEPYAVMNDIDNYFSGRLKKRYIVRENRVMRINRKDLKRAIYESIKGFRPNIAPPASVQSATAGNPSQIGQSTQLNTIPDYDKVELVNDPKVRSGAEWAKYGGNFPIKRNGKIFYVSRSVAVSLMTLCMDKSRGVWCVLANQRGPGVVHNRGKWNIPCGFLDYNESGEDAAKRETFEETGVEIPKEVRLRHLGTRASKDRDTVSMAYVCVLPGSVEDYPLSADNSEPGEVSDIKWIPIFTAGGTELKDVISKYNWDKSPDDIINRAKTALVPYMKTSGDYNKMLEQLKKEIGYNPSALFLLDKILSMKNAGTPTTK